MIIKNEIPILEYDDSSMEVIAPNHDMEDLKLPEKCLFAFLGDVIHEQHPQGKQIGTFQEAVNPPCHDLVL